MDRYLIFDLGGTSVKYAVSDKDGAFDTAGAFATPREGMERMLEEMERVYEAVQTGPGVTEAAPSGGDSCGTRIVGAAISSPGAVDIRTGMVGGISAIPYIHGIPLAEAVSRRLNGIPVTMENDGNCAALGELWKGAAAGRRNMVSVVCGTGIGGAIVVDGRVYRGRTNNAGEFGNYLVNREGGRKRTWSSYTMVNQAVRYEERTGRHADGRELFRLAEAGDCDAVRLVEEFYEAMAVGLFQIQFTLDTELIVLGGGISEAPFVIPEICQRMERLAENTEFGFLMPEIVPCRFGNQANLYGALYHHLTAGFV